MRKTLRLDFTDKFQLWANLVRTGGERFFIPSDAQLDLGSQVEIEVTSPDVAVQIQLRAEVLGRREKSDRFAAGVFVSFAKGELERCRALIGLAHAKDAQERAARRHLRIDCALPVRLHDFLAARCVTKNLSISGMLLTCPAQLKVGQRLELELMLPSGEQLPLVAEVLRARNELAMAALQFVELREETAERLADCIEGLRRAEEEELRRRNQAPSRRIRAVVAAADPSLLLAVSGELQKHGFEVQQASRGDEALELVLRLRPDVAFIDVLLPGLDGLEVCSRLRSDAATIALPIVLLSAVQDEKLHQMADHSGATDYLTKPVPMPDLVRLAKRYTQQ
ncbi:MAG: response regulator [Myxococcota bacterium]